MKILWVSRHNMTNEQLSDLHRIYGNFELLTLDKTITNVQEILKYSAEVYAVVLPTNLLIELKNSTNAEVIQPVSKRVATKNKILNPATNTYEQEYTYKHQCWEKIIRADVKLQKL